VFQLLRSLDQFEHHRIYQKQALCITKDTAADKPVLQKLGGLIRPSGLFLRSDRDL